MEIGDAARGHEAVLTRGTGGQMPRAACRARRRALAVQRWVSNSAPRSLGVCIWRARCLGVGARRALARASVGGHARSQGGAGGPRWRRGGAASHDAERRMRCRATDTNKFLVLVLSRNSCERLRIGGGICRARLSRRAPAPPDGARRRAGPRAAAGAGRARAASAARSAVCLRRDNVVTGLPRGTMRKRVTTRRHRTDAPCVAHSTRHA